MIKVLIVDDHPTRYKPVTDELATIGVVRSDIRFVSSSNEALEELAANRFDLLILDILIPAWPDQEADQVNSADLLFAIQSQNGIQKPDYIVGITADLNAADESLQEFERNTWTVIQYSPTDDAWVGKIVNCVKYLQTKAVGGNELNYDYDLAIVCALKEPELEHILRLPWSWKASEPLDEVTFFREGTIEVGEKQYRVAAVHASRMGMVSSAVLTGKVIERLRPRVLAMTGICAAHKKKAQLGDVVIADPAWDFQSGKLKIENNKPVMEFSPHQISILPFLRGRLEQMTSDTKMVAEIVEEFGSEAPSGFKLRIGPVASGAAVLADGHVIEEIRQFQNRDLIGLEMEVYGVYAAAQQASSPQPRFLAMKGVCDFADPDKHDGAQRFAAFASAQVLKRYVERFADNLFAT
ncbi:MAG: hypothetical protein AAFQ79_05210 [Pseudomonadota bacterium]